MATYTTNLNLKKPEGTEDVSINDINGNMDTLDTKIGSVGSTSLQSQVTTLSSKLTTADAQSMTDLNNVTSTGLYSYDKLYSAMANAPSTGTYFSGTLRVTYYNANKITQEFIHSDGRFFIRHKWNGTWASWTELITSIIEDKKITRVGSYFTERDAFKARRVGNTIVIFSYVNITTQVPSGTNFADTGFGSAEGMYIFMKADGTDATMVTCTVGKLRPSDSVLKTGYYYVSGCAVTPI